MDTEQLRQVIAISRLGTISAAAREMHMTQPTLSRALKRTEQELGCELFNRTGNTVTPNEAGSVVVEHAREILAAEQRMRDALDELARNERTLRIASVAPAPVWNLTARVVERFPGTILSPEIVDEQEVERRIFDGMADMGITRRPLALPILRCTPIMSEHLAIRFPEDHPLASRESITFSEVDGETFLIMDNIGFWESVHAKGIPHSRIVVQHDRTVFTELVRTTKLLSFTTDAPGNTRPVPGHVSVPLSDPDASATFYLVTRREAAAQVVEMAEWVEANS